MGDKTGILALAATITAIGLMLVLVFVCYKHGYVNGLDAAEDEIAKMVNPFDCYEWDGFTCIDQDSPYKCCNIIRQTCSGNLCHREAFI